MFWIATTLLQPLHSSWVSMSSTSCWERERLCPPLWSGFLLETVMTIKNWLSQYSTASVKRFVLTVSSYREIHLLGVNFVDKTRPLSLKCFYNISLLHYPPNASPFTLKITVPDKQLSPLANSPFSRVSHTAHGFPKLVNPDTVVSTRKIGRYSWLEAVHVVEVERTIFTSLLVLSLSRMLALEDNQQNADFVLEWSCKNLLSSLVTDLWWYIGTSAWNRYIVRKGPLYLRITIMDKVMMVVQILWWHTDARQRMEMKNAVASHPNLSLWLKPVSFISITMRNW